MLCSKHLRYIYIYVITEPDNFVDSIYKLWIH